MISWAEFSKRAPELAAYRARRLGGDRVGYLGTLRRGRFERRER